MVQNSEKITPDAKRFCAVTSPDISKQVDTTLYTQTSLAEPPPILFTTTEGSSIDLTEIIRQTISSPSFAKILTPLLTPILTSVVKASVDSALSTYVSSLERKIQCQNETIEDLLVSNNQLKQANKTLNNRIEELHLEIGGLEQYGRRNSLRFHNVPLLPSELNSTD